jgi:Domain of unknown function (DUF4124)
LDIALTRPSFELFTLRTLMKFVSFKSRISLKALGISVLLLIGSNSLCSYSFAQVYRCVEDGEVVFSNLPSSARQKNCVRVRAPKPPSAQLPAEEPVRKSARGVSTDNVKPQVTSSPSSFPKVDATIQKYRDNDRAAILDEERRKEAAILSELKKEFNNGIPERRGDERDQQRYLERVEKLKQSILRAETNVRSLERELQSVR